MATDAAVFDAMCRQAGIVKVDLPMELLDLAAAFSGLPLPEGDRVAVMTFGGGWGVVTADLCARFGLAVPPLSEAIVRRLDRRLPPYWSRTNPVDLVGETDPELPLEVIEELLGWEGCDAVIHLGILGRRHLVSRMTRTAEASDPACADGALTGVRRLLDEAEDRYLDRIPRLMERYGKPVVGVRLLTAPEDRTVVDPGGCPYLSVAYETPERAVRALARMVAYRRFRGAVGAGGGGPLPDGPGSGREGVPTVNPTPPARKEEKPK
jgi:hypothetical protein